MTPAQRPENELLICLTRRSLGVTHTECVRRLLRSDLDWDYVMAMAQRHSVVPLLHYHVNALETDDVPVQVLAQLQDETDRNTRQSLLLTGELLKLMNLLEAQGIPAVPFKGPTLALCAYGDVGLRQFGDLDILVHKHDVLRVRELFVQQGFKPKPEFTEAQEAALLRFDCAYNFGDDKNVLFDLHWDVSAPYFGYQFDLSGSWKRLETVTVASRQIPALAAEDLLLALCLHGSTHFWERLGWIGDVAGLIDCRKDLDWQRVVREAAALGNKRMLLLGLFLASELLEAPLPLEVWRAVRADPVVKKLAEQVQQRLFAPAPIASGALDGALIQLRMRERKRDKLMSCLRLALTPRVFDWMLLPLPGWLFFLYYLLRPLRLAGKYGAKLLVGSHAEEK